MLDLILADARTPTGGFVHSGGVEAARLAPEATPGFVAARLATVGLLDAAVAVLVARGAEALKAEVAWAARTPAAPLREAAARQGRALLRLGDALWPGAFDAYAANSALTPRPVVLGLLARVDGQLAPEALARLVLYDDAATCLAAVPKLDAIDTLRTTAWLAGLGDLIGRLVDAALAVPGDLASLPCWATPLLDIRAIDHHHNAQRLFVT